MERNPDDGDLDTAPEGSTAFYDDGLLACPECGCMMDVVEIDDYQCPMCGNSMLWGE